MATKQRAIDPDKLRKAREHAGYPTQRKAAKALGWLPSRLSNYENGISEPDTFALSTMMKLFGVKSLSSLLREEATC